MYRLLVIFFMSGILLYACRKAKGPSDVPSIKPDSSLAAQLSMSALVNGATWKTDSAYSYKIERMDNDTAVWELMITATQRRGGLASTITFNINDFKGVGAYKVSPPSVTATYYNGNIRHFSSSGTITIQSDTSNLLSGVFNFVADTVSIVDGKFKVAALR